MSLVVMFGVSSQDVMAEDSNTQQMRVDVEGEALNISKTTYENGSTRVLVKESDGSYTKGEYDPKEQKILIMHYNCINRNLLTGNEYELEKDEIDVSKLYQEDGDDDIFTQASYGSKTYERWWWCYWYRSKWQKKNGKDRKYFSVGKDSTTRQPIDYLKYKAYIDLFVDDIQGVNRCMKKICVECGFSETALVATIGAGVMSSGIGTAVAAICSLPGLIGASLDAIDLYQHCTDLKDDFADLQHCAITSFK